MPAKSTKPPRDHALIRKLRKPLAPPTRVTEEERKYKRARERERLRRERPDSNGKRGAETESESPVDDRRSDK